MVIIGQIRMFCGLVGEPSYIAAAEPYYEVETEIFPTLQSMLTQACVSQLSSARDHLETGILSGSVMPPTS